MVTGQVCVAGCHPYKEFTFPQELSYALHCSLESCGPVCRRARRTMLLQILFATVILAVGFLFWCFWKFGATRGNQPKLEGYFLRLLPPRKGKLRAFRTGSLRAKQSHQNWPPGAAAVFVLALLLSTSKLFAQEASSLEQQPQARTAVAQSTQRVSSDSTGGSTDSGGISPSQASDVNAEILQELDRMRARIAELEAKLKQQSGGAATKQEIPAAAESFVQPAEASSTPTAQSPSTQKQSKPEPFAFADFTWLTGNPRTKTPAFDSKFFTPEIRADVSYIYDFNHPKDNTIGGSSEVFRANEFQLTHLGLGGDFHYDNVRARFL